MSCEKVSRDIACQHLLMAFLALPERPPHTMNFYQLDGYIRALCSGPGQVGDSDWLALVFNDEAPAYTSAQEAEQFVEAINALYRFHTEQVMAHCCDLPFTPTYTAEHDQRVNAEQWARGFLQGDIYWEKNWTRAIAMPTPKKALKMLKTDSLSDELDEIISIVTTVADADWALAQGANLASINKDFARLPEVLMHYANIGQVYL